MKILWRLVALAVGVAMEGDNVGEVVGLIRAASDAARGRAALRERAWPAGAVAALIELGAIGVIPKPFDPIALADQINALWETNH